MTHTPAYQLPTQVSPQRYAIRLTPDLRAFTFDGEETVDITVHEPVTEIVLNAIELTIHSVSASGPDGQTLDGTVSLDSEQERASFSLSPAPRPRRLDPGDQLQRYPQRQAARLLPQHLHHGRRPGEGAGLNPV